MYVLHKVLAVFGEGQEFENEADAVGEAIIFTNNNQDGIALIHRADYSDALWTMFKWSQEHQQVVPISVIVRQPVQ